MAIGLVVGFALCLGAIYLLAWLTTDLWYWSRLVVWRGATYDDFKRKFAARAIANAGPPLQLGAAAAPPPTFSEIAYLRISDRSEHTAATADLLARSQTRALVALKDRRIVYESYGPGVGRELAGVVVLDRQIGAVGADRRRHRRRRDRRPRRPDDPLLAGTRGAVRAPSACAFVICCR